MHLEVVIEMVDELVRVLVGFAPIFSSKGCTGDALMGRPRTGKRKGSV